MYFWPVSVLPATASKRHLTQHGELMLVGCGHPDQHDWLYATAAVTRLSFTHELFTFDVIFTTRQ